MDSKLLFILFNFCVCVWTTDLGIVYKHGILLLEDADQITPELPLSPETLEIDLPKRLSYPVALTQDPKTGDIYVADANDIKTEIFAISYSDYLNFTVKDIVPKQSQSAIDDIAYNPRGNQLLWTDSIKHGIYNANISTSTSSSFPNLVSRKNVHKPRGITIDFCRRSLYWTERDERMPTIEKFDMDVHSLQVFRNSRNSSFFQTVDYNVYTQELIWAETSSDDETNSSCTIVTKSLHSGREDALGPFSECYPFALTSDEDNIYWSDWSRHGVMRLSRNGSSDGLRKLVSTPSARTSEGFHPGAFGITKLLSDVNVMEFCPDDRDVYSVEGSSVREGGEDPTRLQKDVPPGSSVLTSSASTLSFKDSSLYHRLRLTIIILSLLCLFFLSTTLLLLLRNLLWGCKGLVGYKRCAEPLSKASTGGSPFKKAKGYKRFGPKSKALDPELCGQSNDGVKIDIEDCCQMTLCDTPCYTSMKKEGKGYKKIAT